MAEAPLPVSLSFPTTSTSASAAAVAAVKDDAFLLLWEGGPSPLSLRFDGGGGGGGGDGSCCCVQSDPFFWQRGSPVGESAGDCENSWGCNTVSDSFLDVRGCDSSSTGGICGPRAAETKPNLGASLPKGAIDMVKVYQRNCPRPESSVIHFDTARPPLPPSPFLPSPSLHLAPKAFLIRRLPPFSSAELEEEEQEGRRKNFLFQFSKKPLRRSFSPLPLPLPSLHHFATGFSN